jgi:hypothetical protein
MVTALRCRVMVLSSSLLSSLPSQEVGVVKVPRRLALPGFPEDEEAVSVHRDFRDSADGGDREQRRDPGRGDAKGVTLPALRLSLLGRGSSLLGRPGWPGVWRGAGRRGPGAWCTTRVGGPEPASCREELASCREEPERSPASRELRGFR